MAETASKSRRLKAWLKGLGATIAGLLLITAAIVAFGEEILKAGAEWAASAPGRQVRIDRLRLVHAGDIRISGVTVADDQGVWATVSRLTIAWRPAALWSGTVHVRAIEAPQVAIRRWPQGKESNEPFALPTFTWPDLPVDVRLDRLAVAELALPRREGLVDAPPLRLRAAAALDEAKLMLDARLTGPADDQARLEAQLTRQGGGRVALHVESDTDGQITEALRAGGLQGLTHVRLDVGDLDPTAEHWRARVAASLGGLMDFTGTLTVGFDPHTTLALVGDMTPGPSLPALAGLSPDGAGPLMEPQKLAAHMELDKSSRITAADLALEAASWAVTARSDGETVGKTWAVTARMDQPPPALLAPYKLGAVQITGALSQQDNGIHTDMRVTLASVRGPDVQVGRVESDVTLAYDRREKRLAASSTGTAHGVKTSLQGLPSGPLRWTLSGVSDPDGLKLTVEDLHDARLRLTGTATLNRTTSALAAKGRVTAKDISDLSQGLRSGALTADVTLNRPQKEDMTLTFSADAPAVPQGRAALDVLGAFTAKGQVAITPSLKAEVTADSTALTLWAQHDADGGSRGTLTLRDGAALQPLMGVAVADGATLDVRRGARGMMARLQAPWLISADKGLRDVSLSARLRGNFTEGRGGVLLTASTPVGPVRMASPVQVSPDAIHATDIVMDSPLATVLGDLAYDRGHGVVAGRLQGASGDLALLRRDYQVDAGGQLTLDVTLSAASSGGQAVDAAVRGQHITLVMENRETVDLDSLDLSGRVEWGENGLADARGALTVAGYRSALLTLDNAVLSAAAADDGVIPWNFEANGYYAGSLNMTAAGTYAAKADGSALQLNSITGELAGRPVALRSPASLTWTDQDWQLQDLQLTLGEGQLQAAAQSNADGQTAHLRLDAADLKILSLATDLRPLGGTASGDVEWRQTVTPELRSSGQLRLSLTQVDLTADQPLSPFDAELTVTVEGDGATVPLKAKLEAKGADMSGVLDVSLPVTVHGAERGAVPPDAPLSGRLNWRGAVAPLLLAWQSDAHTVDGELVADLTLAGTRATPEVQGDVQLVNGRYENLQWGSVLQDIAATVRLSGRRADIVKLTATDGNGGRLTGSGHAMLALGDLSADLRAALESVRLVRTNEASIQGTGNVVYIRQANDARISGDVQVNQAEVSLAIKLPPEVAELQVREINVPAQLALTEEASTAKQFPTKLDLNISADRRVMVRGRGLDSEWRGDVKVSGDSDAPALQGLLTLVRGDFDFAGKIFELTEGTLRFTGGQNIDPLLVLRAEHETFDIKARLLLEGRLSKPQLTLTSVPALPQDEILARILFGTNAQSLTALEAVQLAGAVSALSSSGGGWDVFGLARNALSLDRLTVDSPDGVNGDRSAGPQVTGGKYLTDNVYLEVRTDTETGQSNALLRLDVTRNLQLESSAGSDNDNRLGIRWKKDY